MDKNAEFKDRVVVITGAVCDPSAAELDPTFESGQLGAAEGVVLR